MQSDERNRRFLNLIQKTARDSKSLESVIWDHSKHTFTLKWNDSTEIIRESDITDSSFMIIYNAIYHRALD